ncbi:DUF1294 domain-containing protein [Aquibacillus koreensis]|uniref:DUF1294 domain-containing protein n=2 Tax=Aquibacillus koreensis TaxID=279446 RepID=A0A9X3WII5_9BACI|nr:DUF1294 domain-containing protein [Aquibacillus koreensis]MCT2535056.1 DUF1294 domain-containing protein [Aquibacillus koreensis]MDC3419223.1 DUF1294 domain-containing protein [Aquibacillus koreensis]
MEVLWIYLIIVNLLAYILMGIDKKRARNNQWRISEKTLWLVAFVGGSFGALIGMISYRHKTKHFSFKYGLRLLALIHILLVYYVFTK